MTSKPRIESFAVLTASTDVVRAEPRMRTWSDQARFSWEYSIVIGPPRGVVPAFQAGLSELARPGRIIAMLHDDVLIQEPDWDYRVIEHFENHPRCVLAGFGGGIGLGTDDIYQAPKDLHQLARVGFWSNMTDAEVHGRRTLEPRRVACLDGFSLIGRAEFLEQAMAYLTARGIVHHAYDSWLGALAHRWGGETWLIPVACQHLGGGTAVADPAYETWARSVTANGDQDFWTASHEAMYEDLRGVLPLRFR